MKKQLKLKKIMSKLNDMEMIILDNVVKNLQDSSLRWILGFLEEEPKQSPISPPKPTQSSLDQSSEDLDRSISALKESITALVLGPEGPSTKKSTTKSKSDNWSGLYNIQKDIHKTAVDKGWWETVNKNFGESISLMHSELSEALEASRAGNPPDDKIPEYSGIEAELADCVIRILDVAEGNGFDVIGAMKAKMNYNKTREYKHGGKAF
jgi:hypothetical protein